VQDEGSLAAEAYKLFESRKGPASAVIELKVPPDKAEAFYNTYVRMKELDLSHESTLRRLKELEKKLTNFDVIGAIAQQIRATFSEDNLDAAPDHGDIWMLLGNAENLNALPVDNLGKSTCTKCGAKGSVAVKYMCTQCNEESWWGRWPKKAST
jgi:hypothetical protein